MITNQHHIATTRFSSKWIKEILQEKLGFNGVIFSDDLSMQGAHFIKNIVKRVQVSLESGCDMVLICSHPELETTISKQSVIILCVSCANGWRNPGLVMVSFATAIRVFLTAFNRRSSKSCLLSLLIVNH
jgi:hypothetical protein